MSQSEAPEERWSLKRKCAGETWPLFTGDFQYLNEILVEKPSNSAWLLLQFLNSLFRSFGQVIFANNPVSGAIIILGIGVANYQALLAALLASSLSFIFALITRQDSSAILNGIYGYNPVLHGTISVSLLPALFPQIDISQPKFWLFLTVTSVMSVYITSALNSLLRHIGRYPIPSFTLPFTTLQYLLIFCLLHNSMPSEIISKHLLVSPEQTARLINGTLNETLNNTIGTTNLTIEEITDANKSEHLRWGDTFAGTIVAVSQVYGLNNIPCAALMYLALFVYSPLLTGFAYLGALGGTLLGIMFATNHEEIYAGIWGYNGLLCAAALGGFCFVLNVQSAMIAITSVLFSTALQHIMAPLATLAGFPILTMPFNLTTILFLFITTEKESSLPRPAHLSFPEQHRQQYNESKDCLVQGYLRRSPLFSGKEEI